jgi:hypothetical protein
MKRWAALVLLGVIGGACGGDDSVDIGDPGGAPICLANGAPAAPTITEPVAGRIDVLPATLAITGSPFADPDEVDVFGGVEAEIWRVKDGAPTERVWRAEVAGAAPPTLTLADGAFDAGPGGALEDWTEYAVRIRYRDERGTCSAYGAWSPDLIFRTDDGSTQLFDPGVVRDIYLDIPPESWDPINSEAIPPGCVPFNRSYHTGTLRFEGQTFEGVGIKIKGGCGTSRDLSGKASFKVNLSWDDPAVPGCPEERRLLGEKHLTLNNGVQDNTASHERLGYSYYQAIGVPTPRAASVRVFVNDEYWGLYTHVETVDRRFLSRWFASNKGVLYEGTYWCDLIPQNVPPGDEDSYCLTREFTPSACDTPDPDADPLDYDLLRQLTQEIQDLPPDGFYPEVKAFFDFDTFLSSWAVESVMSHWDAYEFSIQNNYRVYHDPSTGLWTLIPTGIDQTFKDDQDPWDVYGVLATRCVQDPDCEAAFAARLANATDRFEQLGLDATAQAIKDQISPYVESDPRKEYDMGTFESEHEQLLGFIGSRPERVRQYLSDHGF